MRERFSGSMIMVAVATAVISASIDWTWAQAPAVSVTSSAPALKTPWGEPDLQGIWTDETDTPLQRPARYASQEFFTAAQRAELDEARTAVLGNADKRSERGTARDVAGAYNSQFVSFKRTGARNVADCRSAQRPDAAARSGGAENCCRRAGVSSRAVASDRYLQGQIAGLQRREVRSDALAPIRGTASPLQHRDHKPP